MIRHKKLEIHPEINKIQGNPTICGNSTTVRRDFVIFGVEMLNLDNPSNSYADIYWGGGI